MESNAEEIPNLRITGRSDTDDGGQGEEEAEAPVYLAFLEEPEGPEELLRYRFPNKAAGAPAWLDPVNLPSGDSCRFGFCDDPLSFALQVNVPLPGQEETACHRALLVFMCPSMSCLLLDQREQWASGRRRHRIVNVFRCQLPRTNALYSGEEPDTTCTGVVVFTSGFPCQQ